MSVSLSLVSLEWAVTTQWAPLPVDRVHEDTVVMEKTANVTQIHRAKW